MDPSRWERLQSLFHAAAPLSPPEQRGLLETECRDDPSLIPEVMALIAADAGGSLLDGRVETVAQRVLASGATYAPPADGFGPYRIVRTLGEGGMGVVYLAERDDLGTRAAIKILRDAWLSPSRRERFASEQRTLAQLNHPLIARLYDAGTLSDGTPWFVMEYVEGESLTAYCGAHRTPLRDRLRLFRDVCTAVQHAHQHLVIHRDLKPSNVLVTGDGRVKLLDFGIAKQLDTLDDLSDQTRTGLRMMTPAYAAPEQITGGRVGIHTDVYALGVILYELITGRRPFDSEDGSPTELDAALVAAREARRPSAVTGGGPWTAAEWADVDVLCLTAMHRDPARRYATADALIRDVDHFLNGEPLEARPDGVGYRARKFVRRHRAAVAAASGALALVVGLVVFYTVRLTVARNRAVSEAARVQRIQRFTLGLFEGGDSAAGPSDTLHVTTLVDRGLQEAAGLAGDPAVQAELYLTLGGIYQKLGNLARADSLIGLSLERRRAIGGPADVAEALVALGEVRVDEARFDDAERLIREGLAMAQGALPASDPGVVRAMTALGHVLQERGKYADAIPVLEHVEQLVERSGATPIEIAASRSALADAHYYAGHYAASDSLNQEVLATYRRVYGDRHPLVADILVNLGATQNDRGNFLASERLYRQALDITRAFYGDQSYRTAGNLTMLARSLLNQERYSEAAAMLRQALAIREHVYGPRHPSVASTINELGNLALAAGRYDEAEGYFRRMLSIYHQVYGDHHALIGIATSNLATVYLEQHDYARAEPLFRDALESFLETQGPDHLNTGVARIKLGRTLLREHKFADAQVESLGGYEVLSKMANPALSFLHSARLDLATEYDSLKQPDQAARFRAELAAEKK